MKRILFIFYERQVMTPKRPLYLTLGFKLKVAGSGPDNFKNSNVVFPSLLKRLYLGQFKKLKATIAN